MENSKVKKLRTPDRRTETLSHDNQHTATVRTSPTTFIVREETDRYIDKPSSADMIVQHNAGKDA